MTTIEYAEKWFQLHEIPTIVFDERMHIVSDHGFELELSKAEVGYRAELYLQSEISKINNK